MEDVVPDLQIVLGRHSPFLDRFAVHRYVLTDRFERASQKFVDASVKHRIAYVTGHSLGGTQSISVARKHGAGDGASSASPFAACTCTVGSCLYDLSTVARNISRTY